MGGGGGCLGCIIEKYMGGIPRVGHHLIFSPCQASMAVWHLIAVIVAFKGRGGSKFGIIVNFLPYGHF